MTAATNAGWPPLILSVAPTGAHKTKADHPALPMTADEIAATAAASRDAGASMIHLHLRDREGRHLLDADAYRLAITAVRRDAGDDMIIQVTSEAAKRYDADEQMAMVRALRPEAVSLAIREIVPDGAREPEAAAFLAWLSGERILPQYIVYSAKEVTRYHDLCGR
ncbi:MAG: 3-keto-5-aminohexanoate cleavage protein, partial [Alphaproteobacteria bacterium]